jgi:hypothetical protein
VFRFFENIFNTLGRHDNHVTIVAVYLCFAAVLVMLRVFAYLHFRGVLLSFIHTADKKIKDKKEAAEIKHYILKKAVAEYIRVAERAVTSVPTANIVERAVSGMGFLGWKYTGMLPFVEAFEYGILGIGFVFAVIFSEYSVVYGLLSVITFVLIKAISAFFNVRAVRASFCDELVLFIEREIGRFFASDTGGALLRLKNDLSEAIDRQSEAYKKTMATISGKMNDTFAQVSQSMVGAANSIGPIVAKAMDEKLINMNETLTKTLNDWEKALSKAGEIQDAINTGAERLSQASTRIQSASDLLASHMQGHSNALSEQLITLVGAIDEMKAALQILTESQKALTTQSDFIERNQQSLENSLNSYESSLQSLTQSIGDGLGAFINLHAQTSAQTINDTIKINIDKMMNAMEV